jgi:hypothetical protein
MERVSQSGKLRLTGYLGISIFFKEIRMVRDGFEEIFRWQAGLNICIS